MTAQIVGLCILLSLSGFFSGSETAYTSLSFVQIKELALRHGARGKLIEKLTKRTDILLTTILVGNNLVNIGASVLATNITIQLYGSKAIGITTGLLTLFVLIFGEVTPKRIAITHNEFICIHTARLINFLSLVLRPLTIFIGFSSNLITKLVGTKTTTRVSLEGILHMVNLGENMGLLENYETRMVRNIFRFNDVTVHSIMTHRTRVFSLEQDKKISEVLDEVNDAGYSRIPIYDEDPEKITGIVLTQDIMKKLSEDEEEIPLRELKMEPIFVPESKRINEMFVQFKREKLNLAVVLDEYGGLAGIVSLEDVIEEILGELYDEYEEEESDNIQDLGNNTYHIRGDTPIYVLNDQLQLHFPIQKNALTIGGYLSEFLGRFPHHNEDIELTEGIFIIDRIQGNRIIAVRFFKNQAEAEQETEE